MKTLLWNVQGAAKPFFHSTFRRLIQLHNLDICILLETCLLGQSLAPAKRRFSTSWRFYTIEFQDLAGGSIIVWKFGIIYFDVFNIYN